MKKYFEGMRGHEKFTMSLEISSGPPPPGINNNCSLRHKLTSKHLRNQYSSIACDDIVRSPVTRMRGVAFCGANTVIVLSNGMIS